MTEPPTLLIPAIDEETTMLQTRNANLDGSTAELGNEPGPSEPVARGETGALSLRRKSELRRCAEGILVLGLVSALLFVGYQQWRIAESIRQSMGELRNAEPPPPNQEPSPTPERVPLRVESVSDPGSMRQEPQKARIDQLESVGATLIRANDFEAALTHYRALAREIPSESVFDDLVRVLQSKLRCERSLSLANGGCP
jgi:hypothetical protein